MREYLTLHRSVFPSYLTIESGRMKGYSSSHDQVVLDIGRDVD